MADKKPTADNWPVVSGDYIVGDPESPVAVTTLASHNEDIPAAAGAAIAGPCKTENLGIEKVVANIISNPNIRFLILCGAEVQGHITGQSIQALHENGCDPEKKKITGATGAIPFVENIPMEGVERFQQQVELVDMIDNEDGGAITAKVKECSDCSTIFVVNHVNKFYLLLESFHSFHWNVFYKWNSTGSSSDFLFLRVATVFM